MFIDFSTTNTTLCKFGMFATTMTCNVCLRSCLMVYVKRKSALDGYNWSCKDHVCTQFL